MINVQMRTSGTSATRAWPENRWTRSSNTYAYRAHSPANHDERALADLAYRTHSVTLALSKAQPQAKPFQPPALTWPGAAFCRRSRRCAGGGAPRLLGGRR